MQVKVPLKIQVTKQHIQKATKSACAACPIALALLDSGFNSAVVQYEDTAVYAHGCGGWYFDNTPKMQEFITKFDSGEKVSPTQFEVLLIKDIQNSV